MTCPQADDLSGSQGLPAPWDLCARELACRHRGDLSQVTLSIWGTCVTSLLLRLQADHYPSDSCHQTPQSVSLHKPVWHSHLVRSLGCGFSGTDLGTTRTQSRREVTKMTHAACVKQRLLSTASYLQLILTWIRGQHSCLTGILFVFGG